MDEMNKIWDPLRKKDVALTPEEKVRQLFISFMQSTMKIPYHMMMSEVGFKLGQKKFRADILVYDRHARPLAVVECKRPQVNIDKEVLMQAIRYNMVLDVKYIIITNGNSTFMFCKKGKTAAEGYSPVLKVPVYEDML